MANERIGIIGYGAVGKALAFRLASEIGPVTVGVRDPQSRQDDVDHSDIRIETVATACRESDVLFLAVPAEAAIESLAGAELDGTIIVDCTNPLSWDGRPVWDPPPSGSMTAELAAAYPASRCMKGFATFGAAFHRNPDLLGEPVDVHIAGDDPEAKRVISGIAAAAGFHPVDVGPLGNAALLEALAILWIHLARPEEGIGKTFAFQIRTLKDAGTREPRS